MKSVWGITPNSVLKVAAAILVSAGISGISASGATAAVGIPERELDPVVLTGIQTPNLILADPQEIVAFRWDGSWVQVPVQVDERKLVDYRVIRRDSTASPEGLYANMVYADPDTLVGADGVPQRYIGGENAGEPILGTTGDPRFDSDDEVVFMARDAGDSAVDEDDPPDVDISTRTAVRITDPLDPANVRYMYLFRARANLDQAASSDYVNYQHVFSPQLAGGYLSGYNFNGIDDQPVMPPANPEASTVSTRTYEQTFPGKWMVDGLRIKSGMTTGPDILDGDKTTVGTDFGCGRNELTFSRGDGGLIANIDGPVRAIRSYIGANSGTFTQRDQIYYEGRIDTASYVRVHSGIDYIWTALDYSEDAIGMTYRNSLNPAGVTIDGSPDDVAAGKIDWEQASGAHGSLTNVFRVNSNIAGLEVTSNYIDSSDPPSSSSMLCSGDDHAYGAGGVLIKGVGPFTTDPREDGYKLLDAKRTTFFGAARDSVSTARLRSSQVDSLLVLATGAGVDGEGTDGPVIPDPDGPQTPGRQNWVGLKVSVKPASLKLRPGSARNVKVKVRNIGDKTGFRLRICPAGKETLVKTGSCKLVKKLKAGKAVTRKFRVRLREAAAGTKQVKVSFRAKASKSKTRSGTLLLQPKGR